MGSIYSIYTFTNENSLVIFKLEIYYKLTFKNIIWMHKPITKINVFYTNDT